MNIIKKKIENQKEAAQQKKLHKQLQDPKVISAAIEGAIKKQRELAGLKN